MIVYPTQREAIAAAHEIANRHQCPVYVITLGTRYEVVFSPPGLRILPD